MLDSSFRKLAAPALSPAAETLAQTGIAADALTAAGLAAGLAAIPAIAIHHYWIGLALLLLNRLFDALDGALARRTRVTGRGAFLDMIADLIVFAGMPFAFALADPSHALAAVFFLFAITTSGASAIFFGGLAMGKAAENLFGYIGRTMEDSELTLAFALACRWPGWFAVIAYVGGVLCFITAGARIATAVTRFGEP
jgi:phosphatidylglycerophosphate synthase